MPAATGTLQLVDVLFERDGDETRSYYARVALIDGYSDVTSIPNILAIRYADGDVSRITVTDVRDERGNKL